MKQLTNEMCMECGMSVASKGKNFFEEDFEEGHVRAWSKDKWHLLANELKDIYLTDCGLAVLDSMGDTKAKNNLLAT